jgi:hypothetical protein
MPRDGFQPIVKNAGKCLNRVNTPFAADGSEVLPEPEGFFDGSIIFFGAPSPLSYEGAFKMIISYGVIASEAR